MDFQKQLFYQKTDRITIDIKLGFKDESLFLDGYDIGPLVKEWQDDYDYEYCISVKGAALDKLYGAMEVAPGDKPALVEAVAARFNSNKAFSELRKYLYEQKIDCDSFTY